MTSDGVNGGTSITDLPNELIVEIFKYLDVPNRFKLRVNRRFDCIQLSIPNQVFSIEITSSGVDHNKSRTNNSYELIVSEEVNGNSGFRRSTSDFDRFEPGLTSRLAKNTVLQHVSLCVRTDIECEEKSCLDSAISFVSKRLLILSNVGRILPQLTLSRLLTIAQNVECANILVKCNTLTAEDLCTLRQVMIEGNCKLKKLSAMFEKTMMNSFMEKCYGVTMHDGSPATSHRRGFSAGDETTELYSIGSHRFNLNVTHFGSNLKTILHGRRDNTFIEFLKTHIDDISREKNKFKNFKIKFGNPSGI